MGPDNLSPVPCHIEQDKKGAKDLPENYRPVSLTSVCSKVLEHIVHSSVCQFLEKNHILTARQHGFRWGFSCETQLVSVIGDWAKSLNSNIRTDVAIFDFSKAFDTVPHRRLQAKLQSYEIRGHTHTWITSFLSNRSQQVTLNGSDGSDYLLHPTFLKVQSLDLFYSSFT